MRATLSNRPYVLLSTLLLSALVVSGASTPPPYGRADGGRNADVLEPEGREPTSQHDHASPYAHQESSGIAALSAEELRGLQAGEGMGMARAAELNGFPGPKHVLELAEEFGLEEAQRRRIEAIRAAMLEEARRLGAEIVEAEGTLDIRFAHGHVDADAVRELTDTIARLRGRLRAAHLVAHLETTAELDEAQVARYVALRGYETDGANDEHARFTGQVKPVLYVDDVERAADFHRDALGFAFLGFTDRDDGTPYYAEMAAGTQKFGLHEPTTPEQEAWVGHQRLYFRVEDVRAHHARLAARGLDVGPVRETSWMDMVVVRDPAGHEIVFASTDAERHSIDPW